MAKRPVDLTTSTRFLETTHVTCDTLNPSVYIIIPYVSPLFSIIHDYSSLFHRVPGGILDADLSWIGIEPQKQYAKQMQNTISCPYIYQHENQMLFFTVNYFPCLICWYESQDYLIKTNVFLGHFLISRPADGRCCERVGSGVRKNHHSIWMHQLDLSQASVNKWGSFSYMNTYPPWN